MWTSALLVGAAVLAVAEGVCYTLEKHYYETIGCKPEPSDGEGPSSYDCSFLSQRKKDKCYVKDKEFDKGQVLKESPYDPCREMCTCDTTYDGKISFSCVHKECEGGHSHPVGCYRTYQPGKCCHLEEVCGNSTQQKSVEPVCEFKGEKYMLGQLFYPNEELCLVCNCQPGFKGEFVEPFCLKLECSLNLMDSDRITDGCVPVYYGEKGCCPIDWRCPDPADSVVPSEKRDSKSALVTGKTCKFGNLTMNIGDKLSPWTNGDAEPIECKCRVPPHPLCVQKKRT